jgi:hypothetical protein
VAAPVVYYERNKRRARWNIGVTASREGAGCEKDPALPTSPAPSPDAPPLFQYTALDRWGYFRLVCIALACIFILLR